MKGSTMYVPLQARPLYEGGKKFSPSAPGLGQSIPAGRRKTVRGITRFLLTIGLCIFIIALLVSAVLTAFNMPQVARSWTTGKVTTITMPDGKTVKPESKKGKKVLDGLHDEYWVK